MDHKNKTSITRRSALLGGTAGVAAVTAWQTPILKSVILPAHAQMSAQLNFFGGATANNVVNNKSLLDVVIPQAYAGNEGSQGTTEFTIVIAPQESGDYLVEIFSDTAVEKSIFTNIQVLHGGLVPLAQTTQLAVEVNPCEERLLPFEVNILRDNGDSIDIELVSAGIEVNVPAGEGMLPVPECGYALADTYFTPAAQSLSIDAKVAPILSPLEQLIEPAFAQEEASGHGFSVTRNGAELTVTHRNRSENTLRRGTLNINGVAGSLAVVQSDCDFINALPAFIDRAREDELQIVLTFERQGEQTFVVPAASLGSLPLVGFCDAE